MPGGVCSLAHHVRISLTGELHPLISLSLHINNPEQFISLLEIYVGIIAMHFREYKQQCMKSKDFMQFDSAVKGGGFVLVSLSLYLVINLSN